MNTMDEELKKKLIEARVMLGDIADSIDEDNPIFNYFMNGLMFVDEAARIANGECRLREKWLHYYANKCNYGGCHGIVFAYPNNK